MRCGSCSRKARALHGRYDLCKGCNDELEDAITLWSEGITADLKLLEDFDEYLDARCMNPPHLPPPSPRISKTRSSGSQH